MQAPSQRLHLNFGCGSLPYRENRFPYWDPVTGHLLQWHVKPGATLGARNRDGRVVSAMLKEFQTGPKGRAQLPSYRHIPTIPQL